MVLNLLTVLALPFLAAYFPMLYLSFSGHVWYWDCCFTDFGEAVWFLMTCTFIAIMSEVVAAASEYIMLETNSVKISYHTCFHYIS